MWELEAKKRGIRLPAWYVAPTPRKLKTACQSLVKVPFETMFGCSPSKLIELNPNTPLRAFIGQMLELAPQAASVCASMLEATGGD